MPSISKAMWCSVEDSPGWKAMLWWSALQRMKVSWERSLMSKPSA